MGGWYSAATQEARLTTDLMRKTVMELPGVLNELMDHMRTRHDLFGLGNGGLVGSGAHLARYESFQRNHTFGDVDLLTIIPYSRPRNVSLAESNAEENQLLRRTQDAVLDFVSNPTVPVHHDSASLRGNGIILLVGGDLTPVQVDFVYTFTPYATWTRKRTTPPFDVKGAVTGNLFSALGETLNLSLGPRGVRAKISGNHLVPYQLRKGVDHQCVSVCPFSFASDIVTFICNVKEKEVPADTYRPVMGMDGDMTLETYIQLFKFILDRLDSARILDSTATGRELAQLYREKMRESMFKPKFDKAVTPWARASRDTLHAQGEHAMKVVTEAF